jgi:hypothetical protein
VREIRKSPSDYLPKGKRSEDFEARLGAAFEEIHSLYHVFRSGRDRNNLWGFGKVVEKIGAALWPGYMEVAYFEKLNWEMDFDKLEEDIFRLGRVLTLEVNVNAHVKLHEYDERQRTYLRFKDCPSCNEVIRFRGSTEHECRKKPELVEAQDG